MNSFVDVSQVDIERDEALDFVDDLESNEMSASDFDGVNPFSASVIFEANRMILVIFVLFLSAEVVESSPYLQCRFLPFSFLLIFIPAYAVASLSA